MKIEVKDKGERLLIEMLCDVALKSNGMSNLPGVQLILGSMIDEPIKEPDKNDGSNS
ncbi:hypothetical protein LCGC14_1501780 [marine sediment metagenome]|uniref:Uncharacterized protein n=1 Tax=marine sediment metagenome TaxID=412755 RepID=A0A0F9JPS7_9ZZZZ